MRLVTAVSLLFAAVTLAQQTAPPPLVQKIDVTLVNVDVTVLDPKGNPVTDLKKEDFEVREDGTVREITNFALVNRPAPAARPAAEPQPQFTADPSQRRSVVVLVDMRALGEKPNRVRAVDALEKTLADYPDDSNWSVVMLRDGLRSMQTLLPMTTDREAIRWAFGKVRAGEFTVAKALATGIPNAGPTGVQPCPTGNCSGLELRAGIDAAQKIQSSATFAASVINVARGVAWLPGKKVILIVSADVPGYHAAAGGATGDVAVQQAQLHERMVQEANAADASIFVIDPLGVSAALNMGGGNRLYAAVDAGTAANEGRRNTAGAEWLSAKTGGLYLPSNDMGQSLDKLQRATTTYYELAYHTAEADERYHQIAVALKRPGRYTMTYRQGYLRLSPGKAFERTMLSPLGIASQKPTLPLQLTVGKPEASADGWALSLRAEVPVKSLQSVAGDGGRVARTHVYVSVFDKNGQLAQFAQFVETMSGLAAADDRSLVVTRSIRLPKGSWRIFITFRDEVNDSVGIAGKQIDL